MHAFTRRGDEEAQAFARELGAAWAGGSDEAPAAALDAGADGEDFLALLQRVPVRTHVQPYPLAEANSALDDLRHGRVRGAAVLVP